MLTSQDLGAIYLVALVEVQDVHSWDGRSFERCNLTFKARLPGPMAQKLPFSCFEVVFGSSSYVTITTDSRIP